MTWIKRDKFNIEEYLKEVEKRSLLNKSLEDYEKNPNDVNVRKIVGAEVYEDPSALLGVKPDIFDAYVKKEVPKREQKLAENIRKQTDKNLEKLLSKAVSGLSTVDEGLGLLMSLPYTPGFSNTKLDETYGKYAIARQNLENIKDEDANKRKLGLQGIVIDLRDNYGISEEVLGVHVSDPESLVKIYAKNIVPKREDALKELLGTKGKLNNSRVKDFAKYLVSKVKDNEVKDYALDIVSQLAHASYVKGQ